MATRLARPALFASGHHTRKLHFAPPLPFPVLESKVKAIWSHDGPIDPDLFALDWLEPEKPLHIKRLVSGSEGDQFYWPALRLWADPNRDGPNVSGMNNVETEAAIVPVEINRPGRSYNADGWERLEMPFGEMHGSVKI